MTNDPPFPADATSNNPSAPSATPGPGPAHTSPPTASVTRTPQQPLSAPNTVADTSESQQLPMPMPSRETIEALYEQQRQTWQSMSQADRDHAMATVTQMQNSGQFQALLQRQADQLAQQQRQQTRLRRLAGRNRQSNANANANADVGGEE